MVAHHLLAPLVSLWRWAWGLFSSRGLTHAAERGADGVAGLYRHQAVNELLALASQVLDEEREVKRLALNLEKDIRRAIATSALGGPSAQQDIRLKKLPGAVAEAAALASEARTILEKGASLTGESPDDLLRYTSRGRASLAALRDIAADLRA